MNSDFRTFVRWRRGAGKLAAFLLTAILSTTAILPELGQTGLSTKKPILYRVGEQIDPETFVLDSKMQPIRLIDLLQSQAKVVVLVIFGGAVREVPEGRFRGRLWCQDSFDDLAVQRAVVKEFKDRSVQFIPVAIPPIYNPLRYGYAEDVFLGQPEGSPEYLGEALAFIEATEKEFRSGLLPFSEVYYDLRFRLALRPGEQLAERHTRTGRWEGKLKWQKDSRKYGTPTLWLLSAEGRIVREPFFGNDYDAEPPNISYGFRELKEAIEELLSLSS